MIMKPHLCLRQDNAKYGMGTRAFLIHASSCSGSLAVPNCQPTLQQISLLTYQNNCSPF
jgi:hypothetical protein